MSRIPHGREVDSSIKGVLREVQIALKETNKLAGKLLSRGNYSSAEVLVAVAKSVGEFQSEVKALRTKWSELRSSTKKTTSKSREESTPLWEYYQPILKALVALEGESKRQGIENYFEENTVSNLRPGDFSPNSRGVPRWKVMIRRARRQMIKEGFLEDTRNSKWRITQEGRKASKKSLSQNRQKEKVQLRD